MTNSCLEPSADYLILAALLQDTDFIRPFPVHKKQSQQPNHISVPHYRQSVNAYLPQSQAVPNNGSSRRYSHSPSFTPYHVSQSPHSNLRRQSAPELGGTISTYIDSAPSTPFLSPLPETRLNTAYPVKPETADSVTASRPTTPTLAVPVVASALDLNEPGASALTKHPAAFDTAEFNARTQIFQSTGKRAKFRPTDTESACLADVFVLNAFPSLSLRQAIADKLGCEPKQVQFWFQNRRAGMKAAGVHVLRPQAQKDER
ncbi:hypothetical protein HDU78_009873 [Chytriomyces hyalinus]|nr:hypothetical protein HDU78_009873 [Chytriomyces hyalinus]